MGSLVSRESESLSLRNFCLASTLAADLGFGVAFHMDDSVNSRGRICTSDELVAGRIWETRVGDQTVFKWGCRLGKLSAGSWELNGSGGTLAEAMASLTSSMMIIRSSRIVRKFHRQAT